MYGAHPQVPVRSGGGGLGAEGGLGEGVPSAGSSAARGGVLRVGWVKECLLQGALLPELGC